jgi:type I restriction enzyme M protein
MPVLGGIFLRHATNRYDAACREIAQDQAAGKMPKRPLNKADFLKRRALKLPKEARYDELTRLPKGGDFGAALVAAMEPMSPACSLNRGARIVAAKASPSQFRPAGMSGITSTISCRSYTFSD